jgi:hypothetical protein
LEAIQLARERIAERVRKHCAKLKEIAKYIEDSGENSDALNFQVRQLVTKVQPVLARCLGICSRQLVIERFLGNPCIKPSLPAYYLSLKEASAQQFLIEGLNMDLQGVKGVWSQDKLVWKGALLRVVVKKSFDDFAKGQGRALARVLNTNWKNIYEAMKRHRLHKEGSSSQ